jgi:hypothetical protein
MVPLSPTFLADLEFVVEATRHARFRELCDPSSPAFSATYLLSVQQKAAQLRGTDLPPILARLVQTNVAAAKAQEVGHPSRPKAHPSQLTESQRHEVSTCGHRYVRQACCGPVDACRKRKGARVKTEDCCGCVLAGLNG